MLVDVNCTVSGARQDAVLFAVKLPVGEGTITMFFVMVLVQAPSVACKVTT